MHAKALLGRCARMLPIDWRILLWEEETSESTLSCDGPVQIRRVLGGCFAQTFVKGDVTQARATALLRLSTYVGGNNRRSVTLAAARPLLLRKVSGLWQVSVRLSTVSDVHAAPLPQTKKVRVVAQEPASWAVITWHGRLTERSVQRAETAIIDAITPSHWSPCGSAMVRLHAPGSLLPFAGSFEVALPVSAQDPPIEGDICSIGRSPSDRPGNQPRLPVH